MIYKILYIFVDKKFREQNLGSHIMKIDAIADSWVLYAM